MSDVLPGLIPAIGQYYFDMKWVEEVRLGGTLESCGWVKALQSTPRSSHSLVQVDSSLQRDPLGLYRLVPASVPQGGAKAKGLSVPGYRPELTIADMIMRHGQQVGVH